MFRSHLNMLLSDIVLAVCILCGGTAHAQSAVTEQDHRSDSIPGAAVPDHEALASVIKWIGTIEISGNSVWSRDEIIRALRTQPKLIVEAASLQAAADPEALSRWLERTLTAGYHNSGYAAAIVRCTRDVNTNRVVALIEEGQRWKLGQLKVVVPPDAAQEFNGEDLRRDMTRQLDNAGLGHRDGAARMRGKPGRIPWKAGHPVFKDEPPLDRFRNQVQQWCEQQGFWFAEFSLVVTRDEAASEFDCTVTFTSTGEQTRIGKIEVTGAVEQTRDGVLDFLSRPEGLPASRATTDSICGQLEATGRFRRVVAQCDVPFGPDHCVPLTIDLLERNGAAMLGEQDLELDADLLRFVQWLNSWHENGKDLLLEIEVPSLLPGDLIADSSSDDPSDTAALQSEKSLSPLSLSQLATDAILTLLFGTPEPVSLRLQAAVNSNEQFAAVIEATGNDGRPLPRRAVYADGGEYCVTVRGQKNCWRLVDRELGTEVLVYLVAEHQAKGVDEGRCLVAFTSTDDLPRTLVARASFSEGEFIRSVHDPENDVRASVTANGDRLLETGDCRLIFNRHSGELVLAAVEDEVFKILLRTSPGSCQDMISEIRREADQQLESPSQESAIVSLAVWFLRQTCEDLVRHGRQDQATILSLLNPRDAEFPPGRLSQVLYHPRLRFFDEDPSNIAAGFVNSIAAGMWSPVIENLPPAVIQSFVGPHGPRVEGDPVDDVTALAAVEDSLVGNPLFSHVLHHAVRAVQTLDESQVLAIRSFVAENFSPSEAALERLEAAMHFVRNNRSMRTGEMVHLAMPFLWHDGLSELLDVRQQFPLGAGMDGDLPIIDIYWKQPEPVRSDADEATFSNGKSSLFMKDFKIP